MFSKNDKLDGTISLDESRDEIDIHIRYGKTEFNVVLPVNDLCELLQDNGYTIRDKH